MPQYHVGGWNVQPLLAWWVGATVVLERTFDPGRVLQLIKERHITTTMGVPANYLFLAQHPSFADADLSSLRHAIVGGAPMPEPLLRTWHARGVALTQGYGLTEASPNVLCLPDEDARSKVGLAGKPYPHVEVAVADAVTGELLDGEATGELLVRGPSVFAGYFRAPDADGARPPRRMAAHRRPRAPRRRGLLPGDRQDLRHVHLRRGEHLPGGGGERARRASGRLGHRGLRGARRTLG